ncbi:MAG: hypothetical protein KDN19_15000 [Verrucomicrobiae bacterium]|nr:hypothetical protein [Verrucomicrobiae bacterium]
MKLRRFGIAGIALTLYAAYAVYSGRLHLDWSLLEALPGNWRQQIAAHWPGSGQFAVPQEYLEIKKAQSRARNRTWTFSDGSQTEAVLLFADSANAQFRLTQAQGVGQVPLSDLGTDDQEWIRSQIEKKGVDGAVGLPILLKSHRWPDQWRAGNAGTLNRIANTNRWLTTHFDITNDAGINRESLRSITLICEAVDGALNALPLPLPVNWGRREGELRKIVIENVDPDVPPTCAGYWDGATGIVHIYAEFLIEPDRQLVVFEFDKPEKAQRYGVIVHEVTHQSMAALMYLGVPSWVPEGIAEYMAATQFAPGAYHFGNTHVAIRHHINKDLLGDRIVKDRRMNLVHLETLMNRDNPEWNAIVDSREPAGILQYNASLLLIDYFFHRDHPDGQHFRCYLEDVLSGVPEPLARDRHLLRGRSYRQIEREMLDLWRPMGFTINFQERGELKAGDVLIDWGAEDVQRSIASRRASRLSL